jgi:hypothetical protein
MSKAVIKFELFKRPPKIYVSIAPGISALTETNNGYILASYLDSQLVTGVEDVANEKMSIDLFPNPSIDEISISCDVTKGIEEIQIYGLLGNKTLQKSCTKINCLNLLHNPQASTIKAEVCTFLFVALLFLNGKSFVPMAVKGNNRSG